MRCAHCGAALTPKMIASASCEFCGTALPKATPAAAAPVVNHVTNIQVVVEGPGANDSNDYVESPLARHLWARLFGCFSFLVSSAITLLVTVFILAIVGFQMWAANKSIPDPPGQHAPHPKKR